MKFKELVNILGMEKILHTTLPILSHFVKGKIFPWWQVLPTMPRPALIISPFIFIFYLINVEPPH